MVSKIDLSKKGLNIVRSQAGLGKSRYVVGEVGYQALKEGLNVLHVALEEEVDRVYGAYVLKRIVEREESMKEEDKVSADLPEEELKEINESYIKEANKAFSKEGDELGDLAIVSPDIESFDDLSKKDLEKYLYKVYAKNHFDVVIVDPYIEGFHSKNSKVSDLEDLAHNFLAKGFVAVLVMQMTVEMNNTLLKKSKSKKDKKSELVNKSNKVVSLLKGDNGERIRELVIHTQERGKIERQRVNADMGLMKYNKKKKNLDLNRK